MPVGLLGLARKIDFRARGEGAAQGGEVVAVIAGGDDDGIGAEQVCDEGIDQEAVLRHHDIHARPHQGVGDEFQDFVGTVAEDEVGGAHAQLGGELLLEIEGVAIGVKVRLTGGGLEGGQRERGRAEGIFVGGHLDDAPGRQAQFARHFFNGAAGLIDGEIFEGGVEGERLAHLLSGLGFD